MTIGTSPGTADIQSCIEMKRRVRVSCDMIFFWACPDFMIHVHVSGVVIDVIDVRAKAVGARVRCIAFL